jgi:serine/threonine protein kinase
LETEVAVKVIRIENILPSVLDRALKRFEREAKALAKLTHPNIVKVGDYGEHEGKPYLVMPYLPGGTLKLKLGKPIPWREAIQLLIPIADALDYAHGQNMIQRDVKPSNILLTQRGQPMLTDFGIAKVLDLEETLDLTGTSAAVGTPEYMAPEQATAKTVDHRADIYALGVVLYEMVTGRKPFVADTPLAVLFKHASDPLPRPKQFVLDLPDGVEKILLKALAKKPEDRYQSMAEMRTACERVVAGQTKKDATREEAERDAAEKVKQEIADKLKTGEPEPVEEKLARKTSQVETRVTGSQTTQRNLGKQVAFWVIGFVVMLVIGMLVLRSLAHC